jgi:2-methylisocitrate lyase-like PEP mutase family enzyme
VQEIVRSGVAAMQIEDQEAPKKSGTAAGRRLISVAEAVGKIRAAVAARDEIDRAFVICARCDGIGAEGSNFDDTLERCVAYVKDGGADLIWLNSVQSLAQLRRATREIPGPVLAIWGGETAPPSWSEYARTGLNIALYPTIAATSGLQAAWEVLSDFKARGAEALLDWNRRVAANKFGQPNAKKLLGYDKILQIEKRYLPAAAQRDYKTTWGHKVSFADAPAKTRKPAKKRRG